MVLQMSIINVLFIFSFLMVVKATCESFKVTSSNPVCQHAFPLLCWVVLPEFPRDCWVYKRGPELVKKLSMWIITYFFC